MRREIEIALELARELGLRCDRPELRNEGFNLLLALPPHPVVARIPLAVAQIRDPRVSASVEIAFAEVLAQSGIVATRPSALVPPGPHERTASSSPSGSWSRPLRDLSTHDRPDARCAKSTISSLIG